jgi:hypothetical protein
VPVRPIPALHVDRFTPGATPPADELQPGDTKPITPKIVPQQTGHAPAAAPANGPDAPAGKQEQN